VAGKVLTGAATGAVVGAMTAVIPEATEATEKMTDTLEQNSEPGK
jgi:gas vesicle protein